MESENRFGWVDVNLIQMVIRVKSETTESKFKLTIIFHQFKLEQITLKIVQKLLNDEKNSQKLGNLTKGITALTD